MSLLRNVRNLGQGLGDLATRIWQGVQSVGGTLADALNIGRAAGVEAQATPTWHEGYQVQLSALAKPALAALPSDAYVPQDMFTTTTILHKRPLTYVVEIYGRDLEGKFSSKSYGITVSRPITAGEAVAEAIAQFGPGGRSPGLLEVYDVKLAGAFLREGESWRW